MGLMLLSILHLSDIHITSPRDLVLKRAVAIARTTNAAAPRADLWVLLLSGDIAFAGKADQYELAEVLIKEIRQCLVAQHSGQVEVVVVPGNHDCDFALNTGTRTMLLPQIVAQPEAADESVVESCLQVQAPFFRFLGRVEGPAAGKAWLRRAREFPVGGERIRFNATIRHGSRNEAREWGI